MKLVPILLALCACGGSALLADGAEGEFELRPNTVIDPANPSALPPGTIVIASDGAGAVLRIAGDGGPVMEPASLFDAFATARYRGRATLEPFAVEGRVEPAHAIAATGELRLAPQIELAFELDDQGLAAFDAVVRGDFAARLDSLAQLAGGGGDAVTTIPSRPQRVVSTVDGVPVVIVARVITDLAVYAGGSAMLDAEVAADVALEVGVRFTRAAGWSTTDASRPVVAARRLDANGAGHATVVATMRLELALYGEVVPYVQLRTISSAETGACEMLEAYVGAGVGIEPSTILPGAQMRYAPVFGTVTTIGVDACP